LHSAVLLGYKIYADEGNSGDTDALFPLHGSVLNPFNSSIEYRREGVVLGQTYKYRITAVTEAGEGSYAAVSLIASTVPSAPAKPEVVAFSTTSIDITWQFIHDIRGTGGVAIDGWKVFYSTDPRPDNWNSFSLALSGGDTTQGAANVPCTQYQYVWVQVAATNALGTGLQSERAVARCARPPGDLPIVTRVDGTETSITIEYSAVDYFLTPLLYGATLLGFKISWDLDSVIVGPTHRRYTVENLLPGWPYNFTIQAITETGTSVVLHEEILYTGGTTEMEKPMFYESDGESITLAWPVLTETLSSPLVSYEVFISADERTFEWFNLSYSVPNQTWPLIATPEHPESAQMAVYVHNCSATKSQLHKDSTHGGLVTLENRETNYLYARVAARTVATLGKLSDVATLFCAPRPDAPKVRVAGATEDAVILAWNTTDLYGAPVVAYNIYSDDGLGGDIKLNRRLEGHNATLYDPVRNYSYNFFTQAVEDSNATVSGAFAYFEPEPFRVSVFGFPISGLEFGRLYRFQVTVVSAAAESKRSEIKWAQTCRSHATAPYIEYFPPCAVSSNPNSTDACLASVKIHWHPFNPGPFDCAVWGYEIFAEHEGFIIQYVPFNGTTIPQLVSDWSHFDIWNETYVNVTGTDRLISPTTLSYMAIGLTPGETYRFKVRTVTLSGHTDSRWVVATPPR